MSNNEQLAAFEEVFAEMVKEVEVRGVAWAVEDVPDDWCERVAMGIVWSAFANGTDVEVGDAEIKTALKNEGWLEEASAEMAEVL
jgi:hypothetical protein